MTAPLDPETKRLRRLSPGALADKALALKKRIDAIKDEAIRRRLKTAEGEAGRIVTAGAARFPAALRRRRSSITSFAGYIGYDVAAGPYR